MQVTSVELWPHQKAALTATLLAMNLGQRQGLVVLPTGAGKTGFVLALGRRLESVPMLFLVQREELLAQTVAASARFWPEAAVAQVTAGATSWDVPDLFSGRRPDLVVAMVPTLVRRLAGIDPERFGLVVFDECHLAPAPTPRKTLEHFRPGFRLGVTATPHRLDGRGLAGLFGERPLYTYPLYQAIKDGVLCQVDPRRVLTGVDLDSVGTDGDGDLDERALAREVNTPGRNARIVGAYLESALDRRAIAFAVDVEHALTLAAAFQSEKVPCEAVTGRQSPAQRREVLDRFARGELRVVTNCEVLTYGFDDPGVSCLLMARPTESRALWVQMAGRGLRRAEGKKDCLILDFVDNSTKHKLVCAPDLLGRQHARQEHSSSSPHVGQEDGPVQQIGPLPVVSWRLESACPWPELPSLDGYVSSAPWHEEPASQGQLSYLRAFGVLPGGALTRGEASYLIDRCREYDAAFPPPATPGQKRYLSEKGIWTEGLSRQEASLLITRLRTGAYQG